ncbi:MAG: chemotaxis response regulator protein-glutamate methylesterase [Bryobacteraceae bacterium]|nr:chemotaxis response regulator protein-glutamate methylesterase [Bryobacteraceae bacterium]
MRIGIVNDLPLAVEVLRRVTQSAPGCEVAWTAANGAEAVAQCAKDRPDLVLMDLIMPVMDGVQATAEIMRRSPCAILVVTASVGGNASKVFEAMGCGALDAVATPVWGGGGRIDGAEDLLRKIAVLGRLIVNPAPQAGLASPRNGPGGGRETLVAIGASTGGPKALAAVLQGLPAASKAAVVVAQHLDAQFSPGLAEWLGGQTELEVALARDGMKPAAGKALISGANDHLVMGADGALRYEAEPLDYPYRPSVDELFLSLARHGKEPGVAALLTGMGRDGARGLLALRRAGWRTIAQDEATSVIYGMPRAAVELGAACEVLPLGAIGGAIAQYIRKGS